MDDQELLRYSRQIMLPEIDIAGQEQLRSAHVVIVGLGGLGCPAALYLAGAGVGRLTLIDPDTVDISNLQRQVAHVEKNIGVSKVASAAEHIKRLAPCVELVLHQKTWSSELANTALQDASVILDCTDNLSVRLQINQAAFNAAVPLITAAAIGWEGQISLYDFRNQQGPCYQCLYKHQNGEDLSCAANGVIAPLVGIMGSMQAMEAVKLICGVGETLAKRMLILDGKYMQWRELKLSQRSGCPVCCS